MNGLPKDFDASGFVGRTLDVMTVGQYQLTLVFSGNCTINIEGKIAVAASGLVELPTSILLIYPFINKEVTAASATESGTLTLVFENETKLQIFDSNTHLESYHFYFGKELFVV